MPHDIRLFSDVNSKMTMFDQRAREHRQNQLINPFSEWSGAGTRRKLSRDDPDYGKPVEGSKTAERGKQAQLQMISDMVQLCDFIYDCGIRSPDGRAAIAFGNLFRLYSTINDKCVGLLMRGRRHKILDFTGEMLFQRRDDEKMIELLLPLNTIRHRYGLPERMGAGEVRLDLLEQLAAEEKLSVAAAAAARAKKQRARSLDLLPTSDNGSQAASSSKTDQQQQQRESHEPGGSESNAAAISPASGPSDQHKSIGSSSIHRHKVGGSESGAEKCGSSDGAPRGRGVWSLTVGLAGSRAVSQPDLTSLSAGDSSFKSTDYVLSSRAALSSPPLPASPLTRTDKPESEDVPDKILFTICEEVSASGGESLSTSPSSVPLVLVTQYSDTKDETCEGSASNIFPSSTIEEPCLKEFPCKNVTDHAKRPVKHIPSSSRTKDTDDVSTDEIGGIHEDVRSSAAEAVKLSSEKSLSYSECQSRRTSAGSRESLTNPKKKERRKSDSTIHQSDTEEADFPLRSSSSTPYLRTKENPF